MHEHVDNSWIVFLDRSFHLVRNMVAFAHGNIAVNADVEIGIKTQAHLAQKTFFHFNNARDRRGRLPHSVHNLSAGRGIHEFVQSRIEKAVSVRGDQGAGEERGPIVRALPFFAADQCDRDANEGRNGG